MFDHGEPAADGLGWPPPGRPVRRSEEPIPVSTVSIPVGGRRPGLLLIGVN